MQVFVLPPKESDSNLVNFDSLYGICGLFSTKAFITLPRVNKDLLILLASYYLKEYVSTPDLLILSDPAKSTKLSLLIFKNSSS